MTEIFKIQRPIVSSFADTGWLIYNESRSVTGQIRAHQLGKGVIEMMGADYKMYCEGSINEVTGQLEIVKRVDDQLW